MSLRGQLDILRKELGTIEDVERRTWTDWLYSDEDDRPLVYMRLLPYDQSICDLLSSQESQSRNTIDDMIVELESLAEAMPVLEEPEPAPTPTPSYRQPHVFIREN